MLNPLFYHEFIQAIEHILDYTPVELPGAIIKRSGNKPSVRSLHFWAPRATREWKARSIDLCRSQKRYRVIHRAQSAAHFGLAVEIDAPR